MDFLLHLETKKATLENVGGKGMNLSRLSRLGFNVPKGFLIITDAYNLFVKENKLQTLINDVLEELNSDCISAFNSASDKIRQAFSNGKIPKKITTQILQFYNEIASIPVAVRSSATAEDLPEMSFAGQQDTILNVIGEDELLKAVVDCWSSLWTARAIAYRIKNKEVFDESLKDISLAVVVQQMIESEVSGVMFTANPLNGRRDQITIDATYGLGEALVSGLVEPDNYLVNSKKNKILSKTLGAKALSISGNKNKSGTVTVEKDISTSQALDDDKILELAELGNKISQKYNSPQDIEWALFDNEIHFLQTRPITSLFPIPENIQNKQVQVFFSFAAVQGMFNALTPLGQDTIKGLFAGLARLCGYKNATIENQKVVCNAGERLWINCSLLVRNRYINKKYAENGLASLDPGMAQAVLNFIEDERLGETTGIPGFRNSIRILKVFIPLVVRVLFSWIFPDFSRKRMEQRIDKMIEDVKDKSEAASNLQDSTKLYEYALYLVVKENILHFISRIVAGIIPMFIIRKLVKNLSDGESRIFELYRGLPHNVTTEMDLSLWDTAQSIKSDKKSLDLFIKSDKKLLTKDYLAGDLPETAQTVIKKFLEQYGSRGIAEIDLGRIRWNENPEYIMQILKSYIENNDPKTAPDYVFKAGTEKAQKAIIEFSKELKQMKCGWLKAKIFSFLVYRIRALSGLREAPKFCFIRIFELIRNKLLVLGNEMVKDGQLSKKDDLFYLNLDELNQLVIGEQKDLKELIAVRRDIYKRENLRKQIPRVLLSDGQAFYEGFSSQKKSDDENVVYGSPVSPGFYEGKIRIVHDPMNANLQSGEIMVCHGTDPAWTPLFMTAGALITEVGGLMQHGSVVAREYGIPAVVGVHEATGRFKTGQKISINGSSGEIIIK